MVPMFHYVLWPVLLFLLIASCVNFYHNWEDIRWYDKAPFMVAASIALILMAWYIRSFPLKAQDRAIRAEENLRHFALTGKLLDKRLQMRQVIALRFAGDDQFPKLAQEAAEKNMGNKEIKQAIVNWRDDDHWV